MQERKTQGTCMDDSLKTPDVGDGKTRRRRCKTIENSIHKAQMGYIALREECAHLWRSRRVFSRRVDSRWLLGSAMSVAAGSGSRWMAGKIGLQWKLGGTLSLWDGL